MKFTKMQGCGNDYVYVNGFTEKIDQDKKPEVVRFLSDRHFGIGGDGVIFINPSDKADFEMEMFNADGTRSEMCGNGIRCVAKFVYDYGMTTKTKDLPIISGGHVKYLDLTVGEEGKVSMVKVNMGAPILTPSEIPVVAVGDRAINLPITVQGEEYHMTCVSMGNPHAIVFVDDVKCLDLEKIGPSFEKHEIFPDRVNTEFIHVIDRHTIDMRVWERGSGETFACGTGTCASVVACVLNGLTEDEVLVHLLGGDLKIHYDREKDTVYMTGPATVVCTGEVEV